MENDSLVIHHVLGMCKQLLYKQTYRVFVFMCNALVHKWIVSLFSAENSFSDCTFAIVKVRCIKHINSVS